MHKKRSFYGEFHFVQTKLFVKIAYLHPLHRNTDRFFYADIICILNLTHFVRTHFHHLLLT